MKRGINNFIAAIFIFILFSLYAFAAGGGGGGGSSSGPGFSSARDSVFIVVNADYSSSFYLKNNTKYDLRISTKNGNATLNFGSYFIDLEQGDNLVDLNDNSLVDINFRLERIKGSMADIRVIDIQDRIPAKPKPVVVKTEKINEEDAEREKIRCSGLETMKERVSCRLGLDKERQERELELYYLPEECRAVYFTPREQCIARYKSVQTCWQFPAGSERVLCVKRVMKLGTLQEETEKCKSLEGDDKSACVKELSDKMYNMIKWRFYDLEERAEDFMARGLVGKDAVVDFIARVEENKIRFNEAKTYKERKDAILDVRVAWKGLVHKISENVRG